MTPGAFGADEDLVEIGAGRVFGHGQSVDDIAVGQNDFHADALVVDLAVLGGHDADAAMAQGSRRWCRR